MNLIEQAAHRLEQLRKAGAEVPVGAKPAAGDPSEAAATERRDGLGLDTVPRAMDVQRDNPAAAGPAQAMPSRAAPPTHSAHRVELNLARLAELGFITPDAPMNQIADEFRVIKRPILRNALGKAGIRVKNGNLIMVTSALPGEGKTFTSLNLALSIALEYDNTVLLVDGDVAHPTMPSLLGTPNSPGLLDLLTRDDIDVSDALVKTNVEKLSILPAGSRHRRSTELLASEQMASLLRELATRYSDRIIVFDSPPLLATTEARVLATLMGQIIMVVGADATSQHAVTQALATIEHCEIVLMMLNNARQSDVGSYYGYYGDDPAR